MKAPIKKIGIIALVLLIVIIIYEFNSQIKYVLVALRYSKFATVLTPGANEKNMEIIKESGELTESNNSNYWLNSGAIYYISKNSGHTIIGDLPNYSPWRLKYELTNPIDTDDGYHPQNLFRLITKKMWLNFSQSFYVLVIKDNLSQSPNRNESNGILLISRYIDSNNLYYAGIRVDGSAIIKKKIDGVYHTLAQTSVFTGDRYNKNINPSLIPKNQWVGIKVDTQNIDINTVEINLYLDKDYTGVWDKILSVKDTDSTYNPALLKKGHAGIRSDFMDIEIKNDLYSLIP